MFTVFLLLLWVLDVEEVTHLRILSVHIELIILVGGYLYRFATYHLETKAIEAANLLRIVGHETKFMNTKVGKDAGTRTILTQVGSEAKGYVSLYGVHTLILQVISAKLIDETYAAPLLTQIEQHTPTLFLYTAKSLGKLFATVAAQRTEGIARQALGMNTAEDRFGRRDITLDESHVMLARHLVDIAIGTERAVLGRKVGTGDLLDEFLRTTTVFYQRLDGNAHELMLISKLKQFLSAHHRTILTHYLTTEASLGETSKATEVNSSLGMPGTNEHATITSLQWEHVTRTTEVDRLAFRISHGTSRNATLNGRDACGGRDVVDTNGESRLVVVAVMSDHLWEV